MRCPAIALVLLACGGEDETVLPPPPPPAGCKPGEATLEDGRGRPAGIAPEQCGEGFVHEGDECFAVLPSEPCGDGLMAVPGETECREVAPCPEGRWGDIPVDGTTVFVDASFAGTSDGSATAPFVRIQDAVSSNLEAPEAL